MRVERKLEIFRHLIIDQAEGQRRGIERETEEAFNSAAAEAERAARKSANERVRAERYNVDKVKNKKIVAASADAKRRLIELRNSLTDALFDGVTADIQAFAASPEYENYLLDLINKKQTASGNFYQHVQLMPSDMRFAALIKKKTGLDAEEQPDIKIGGFRLLSADRRAVADCTLDERINAERRGFSLFIHDDMRQVGFSMSEAV